MNRASPADLRIALQTANEYVKSGIAFVPMPARDDGDLSELREEALRRLNQMVEDAETKESSHDNQYT